MNRDDFKLGIVIAMVTNGCKSPTTAFNTAEEYAKKAETHEIKFEESTGPILNVSHFVDGRTEVNEISQKVPTMQELGPRVCSACTLNAKCSKTERAKILKDGAKLCRDAYDRYINKRNE